MEPYLSIFGNLLGEGIMAEGEKMEVVKMRRCEGAQIFAPSALLSSSQLHTFSPSSFEGICS